MFNRRIQLSVQFRVQTKAVGQNLAAFVIGAGAWAMVGLLAGCQLSPSGWPNPSEPLTRSGALRPTPPPIARSHEPSSAPSSIQIIAPGGFNQRYADWLDSFQPLDDLVTQFNQLIHPSNPIRLIITPCEQVDGIGVDGARREQRPSLQLCIEWIAELDDAFDDLSASPREQQLAVLDATFLWVSRQLSDRLLREQEQEGNPDYSEQLDQLTVLLPQLLQPRSPGVALSGTQWVFNQGHPQGVEQRLAQISGLPLTLDNYERLICYAYGSAPQLYPYLESEFPDPDRLAACQSAAQMAMRQWQQRLAL